MFDGLDTLDTAGLRAARINGLKRLGYSREQAERAIDDLDNPKQGLCNVSDCSTGPEDLLRISKSKQGYEASVSNIALSMISAIFSKK